MEFTKDSKTASVSRLWYTTSQSWYKKSWYTATGKSYTGHLKALTVKDWIELSNFWKEFQFNTEYNADIKESDKLTIDSITYDVKWVSKYDWKVFSRLVCILQKW